MHLRSFMSSRFGHDFSSVRVHTDAHAAQSAENVDANAYTVGEDVVFGAGRWDPASRNGTHLLAHELAHVVQQRRGGSSSPDAPSLDAAANRAAGAVVAGGPVRVDGGSAVGVARQARSAAPQHGTEQVTGLHVQKAQLTSFGGNSLDMAIAMLETRTMTATYTYGDGKSGDAANFGIFKQNWMMIRSAHPAYAGLGSADYGRGAALNTDLRLDVTVLHESQAHYGTNWFAGHRNGASGLTNPGTRDIAAYRDAVLWIKAQLDANPSYLTDDTRVWVAVPAI